MKFKKLYDLCEYVNQKINSSSVNVSLYISTENMLPQKGGIVRAESIPINGKVNSFLEGDTLVSNIRPYFKKIWKASFSGACSNDVLIFRARESVNKMFLYYLLSEDKFFDYSMASSKGTKMPRGDKKCLMEYEVPDYPRDYQDKIVKLLSSIDKKIEINNLINKNLEEQAQSIFSKIINKSSKFVVSLSEIAMLNPRRILSKGKIARYIDMSQLSTSTSFPSGWDYKKFNGGMRFCNGDTLLARITPCLENGKTAYVNFLDDKEVAFGSTEYIVMCSKGIYPNEFFYCLARYSDFVDYAVKNMNGSSGRQRVSAEIVGKYELPKINDSDLQEFMDIVPNLFNICRTNNLENMNLEKIRDTLLPRLMSGEIDVSKLGVG